MQRSWLALGAFVAVALFVVGGVHWYLWTRLVRAPDLQAPWRQLVTGLLVAGFASLPLAFAMTRTSDSAWARGLIAVGFSWLGMLFLLILGAGGSDLLHGGARLWHKLQGGGGLDPERRLFLARLGGGAASALATLGGGAALWSGLRQPELREVEVRLDRLPKSLDGLSIVQISDLHVGPTIRRDDVEALVARCNALQPDIVAITGDLVDGPVALLRSQTAPLGRLQARHGVYFVTGNHEYYSGAEGWLHELTGLGIRCLRNERVPIGSDEAGFDLAGVDDYTAHRFGRGHGADLAKALQGRDPTRELVLLAHQPRAIHEAAEHGVGLQLSGHTHGGQIWPFGFVVRLVQPYVAGLARHGQTWIYVSRGTGYWGPPMRLAAPSELTRIVLRAAA